MQSVNMPNGGYENGMGQYAVSASGDLIYVPGGVSPSFLYSLVRVDRKGVETEIGAPKAGYGGPRVSPDGQRLVTGRGRDNSRISDIWVVDLSNGSSTRVTNNPEGAGYPIWSPDGKRILVGDLSIASDGSGATEKLNLPGVMFPSSWVGDQIAYLQLQTVPSRQMQVWTKSTSGQSEAKRFSESQASLRDPSLSPDGHWMVYTSNESGDSAVYVQAFPSGEKHKVSSDRATNPVWARNGRELFYLAFDQTSKVTVMAVDFTPGGAFKAGAPHALFSGEYAVTTPLRNYDVTPDGHFIMTRVLPPPDQRVTKMNVVLNWFDELKNRAPQGGR